MSSTHWLSDACYLPTLWGFSLKVLINWVFENGKYFENCIECPVNVYYGTYGDEGEQMGFCSPTLAWYTRRQHRSSTYVSGVRAAGPVQGWALGSRALGMEDHSKARLHQKRCKQLFHTGSDFPVFRKLWYFHVSAKARIPQVLSLVGIIKSCFHGPARRQGASGRGTCIADTILSNVNNNKNQQLKSPQQL